MIFGEPIQFDDRYGIYMNDFFNLVNSAYLTCDVTHNTKTSDLVIHFNYYQSETIYRKALEIKYNKAINEFEKMIAGTINKQDKLRLITHLIGEFNSLTSFLNKNATGSFSHKFFKFKNLSQKKKDQDKIFNESICQDYYFWMNNYLEKIKNFLKDYKEDVGHMSQNDIINHPSGLQDTSISTMSNPLNFFVQLSSPKGLDYLLQNFISTFNDDQYNYNNYTSYDSKTETMYVAYSENENGELETTEWRFKDYYLNRISKEYNLSIKYINDYINDQKEESTVIFYLKQNHLKLNSLLKAIGIDKNNKKYEDRIKPIKDLIQHIKTKESEYTNNEKQVSNYFKIKVGSSIKNTAKSLFDVLADENYIDVNSKNDFIDAFTGNQPVNKIKWIGLFGDLKTFINYSIEKKLIDKVTSKWHTTASIFTNNGLQFDHKKINDTKITKNKTAIEKRINSIINSVQP